MKYQPLAPKDRIAFVRNWPGMRPLDDRKAYVEEHKVMQTIAGRYKVDVSKLKAVNPLSDGHYAVYFLSDDGIKPGQLVAYVKPWPKNLTK